MNSPGFIDLRFSPSASLQTVLNSAVAHTVAEFSRNHLKADELAVTLYDLTALETIQIASHRGDQPVYPASIVKLFYLVAAHRWMEHEGLKDSAELRRALRNMIVDSSNDATHYVIDLLTETTSGPELPTPEMADWEKKRNAINRYFLSSGYPEINLNQKPWCEGPFGRERVFMDRPNNRNSLTTDATARLLTEIALGKAVSPIRSKQMLELLKREPFESLEPGDPDDQAHAFTARALSPGSKLWSKAGWTSQTRHDAAYIELPSGKKVVLVIFTIHHAKEREILPTLARKILAAL